VTAAPASPARASAALVCVMLSLAGCAPRDIRPAWVSALSFAWSPPPSGSTAATSSRASLDRVAPALDIQAFHAARARLLALQGEAAAPRTLRVAVALREPFTGRTLEARGAIAASPPSALRMILLGPGGTTALDLWLARARYRFAVPAIDLLRHGDAREPPAARRGLPVDFLRWWLLRPAEGSLLWAARRGEALHMLLRDGAAIVDLSAEPSGKLTARRATYAPASLSAGDAARRPPRLLDEEYVAAAAPGCAEVRYYQASTGLEVTVRCEGEDLSTPSPRAFVDPDAPADPTAGEAP
jgi:hypothetical protein